MGGNMKRTSPLTHSDPLIYHPDQNTFKKAKAKSGIINAVTIGHRTILEKPANMASLPIKYLCQLN